MTTFMQRLDKKELQEAEAKAEKWSNQASNAAVQAKTARKKGEKMVKSFAKEMFSQAGMRVFVWVHGRMRRVACSHLGEFFPSPSRSVGQPLCLLGLLQL
jgi:hypothetical protein